MRIIETRPERIIITQGVSNLIDKRPNYCDWVRECLNSYIRNDWRTEGRSRYKHPRGDIIIKTEGEATTVLLPEEL